MRKLRLRDAKTPVRQPVMLTAACPQACHLSMLVGVVRLPSADQRLPEGIRQFANQQVLWPGLCSGTGRWGWLTPGLCSGAAVSREQWVQPETAHAWAAQGPGCQRRGLPGPGAGAWAPVGLACEREGLPGSCGRGSRRPRPRVVGRQALRASGSDGGTLGLQLDLDA